MPYHKQNHSLSPRPFKTDKKTLFHTTFSRKRLTYPLYHRRCPHLEYTHATAAAVIARCEDGCRTAFCSSLRSRDTRHWAYYLQSRCLVRCCATQRLHRIDFDEAGSFPSPGIELQDELKRQTFIAFVLDTSAEILRFHKRFISNRARHQI